MTRDAVIVDSLRTGLTKAHRGSFNLTEPVDYTAHVLREVAGRHGKLDPEEIEDVIVGCAYPEGCQGMNMARISAMAAGLPVSVAATTVNRFCSSGSQAIAMAAQRIAEGADAAIGAGCETITMMQDGTQNTNRLVNSAAKERFPGLYYPMGVTAEIVAERYGISREDQDAYALQSQQRYAKAVEEGKISGDIAPMQVRRRVMKKGEEPYEEGRPRRCGRVQPAGHHRRGPGGPEARLQAGGGGRHRDRRQRLPALRRRLGHPADERRARRAAGHRAAGDLPGHRRGGLRARGDGCGAGLRGAQAAFAPRPCPSTTSI